MTLRNVIARTTPRSGGGRGNLLLYRSFVVVLPTACLLLTRQGNSVELSARLLPPRPAYALQLRQGRQAGVAMTWSRLRIDYSLVFWCYQIVIVIVLVIEFFESDCDYDLITAKYVIELMNQST